MGQTHLKLSPIKKIYCINCHKELILDLAERRGEKQIICPKCKTSFLIKKAEKFMSNISPKFDFAKEIFSHIKSAEVTKDFSS